MASNYTQEQVEHMIELYTAEPTRETVEKLSEEFGKSIKSIIGKLSREGVYQKAVYKTKTGEIPVTKAQLVVDIATLLEIDSSRIVGLEKAPKQDIKYLHDTINGGHHG
jgi:N-methylhydantoinase B/oxoprolinase/acetone carboxylase alpha subunit|tara:strand:- start:281 stop:607 length:327 start_codon:yes stop_codon:yes gene_type:complete